MLEPLAVYTGTALFWYVHILYYWDSVDRDLLRFI